MKITTKPVSNSPVTFVTQEHFAVLFFLPSFYVNSLKTRTSTSRTSNITTGSWSLLPFSGLTRWRHPTGVPVTIRLPARGLSSRLKMSCKRDVESYTFHRSLRSGTKVQVQSTFGGGYTQQFRCARYGVIYRLGKLSLYQFVCFPVFFLWGIY